MGSRETAFRPPLQGVRHRPRLAVLAGIYLVKMVAVDLASKPGPEPCKLNPSKYCQSGPSVPCQQTSCSTSLAHRLSEKARRCGTCFDASSENELDELELVPVQHSDSFTNAFTQFWLTRSSHSQQLASTAQVPRWVRLSLTHQGRSRARAR